MGQDLVRSTIALHNGAQLAQQVYIAALNKISGQFMNEDYFKEQGEARPQHRQHGRSLYQAPITGPRRKVR
jgi:hypothetical protein